MRLLRLAASLHACTQLAEGGDSGAKFLESLYVKFEEQSVDTEPAFDPRLVKYEATMNWKMKFFSVQAKTVSPSVIENIHLCRQDADCEKEDQSIVVVDFSRNVLVAPGGKVRFKFDVIRHGQVKSYTLIIQRLKGSETSLQDTIARGLTLWPADASYTSPGFKKNVTDYRCLMDVNVELALFELHLLDAGQTVFASAEAPVLLGKSSNFTLLKNTQPGIFTSPPLRRLAWDSEAEETYDLGQVAPAPAPARRLIAQEKAGEFQYPNRYFQFPVPLGSVRKVSFKVISSDGGHFGFYSMEVARSACPATSPLFDVVAASCVRFCNTGFFSDFQANRCKRCEKSCFTCLSSHACTTCPKPTRRLSFVLDNSTGTCVGKPRSLWQQHPQKTVALVLASLSLLIFICGLCAFRFQGSAGRLEDARRRPAAPPPAAPSHGERRAPRFGESSARGPGGGGWGGSSAKYTRISASDDAM